MKVLVLAPQNNENDRLASYLQQIPEVTGTLRWIRASDRLDPWMPNLQETFDIILVSDEFADASSETPALLAVTAIRKVFFGPMIVFSRKRINTLDLYRFQVAGCNFTVAWDWLKLDGKLAKLVQRIAVELAGQRALALENAQ